MVHGTDQQLNPSRHSDSPFRVIHLILHFLYFILTFMPYFVNAVWSELLRALLSKYILIELFHVVLLCRLPVPRGVSHYVPHIPVSIGFDSEAVSQT